MVLIGHSMGGLVAKLQVTYSGNDVWNEVASQPLSAIRTDEQTRFDLSRAFYFDPSPDITRVLFIGTPHQGSSAAQLAIGRVASALVEEPSQMQARHAQLVSQNPGVFRQEVLNRVPTSIDLLEPGSNLLQATTRLPFREGVRLHSILGTGVWRPRSGESDGVVPVYSSRLYGVQSELVLDAKHTELHHRPESLNDILGILKEHAAAYRGIHPSLIDAHVRSSGAFRY
jgi:hypothetical protein